ncbi:MAG TPA: hypothetical protein VFL54_04190 [Gammaproteobacteria bacterium]|nr:hypothetical protein [Gammaproteobacteria bacterium]
MKPIIHAARGVGLGLVLLAFACTAQAADKAGEQAVHYPLTMQKMHAYFEAMLNMVMATAASKDPKLADGLSVDADWTFDEDVAHFSKTPFRQAIEKAHLTPAEYVKIQDAYMGGAFGAAYEKMKGSLDNKVYDRHNVDFVKQHQEDIKKMQAAMQKEAAKLMPADEDD